MTRKDRPTIVETSNLQQWAEAVAIAQRLFGTNARIIIRGKAGVVVRKDRTVLLEYPGETALGECIKALKTLEEARK